MRARLNEDTAISRGARKAQQVKQVPDGKNLQDQKNKPTALRLAVLAANGTWSSKCRTIRTCQRKMEIGLRDNKQPTEQKARLARRLKKATYNLFDKATRVSQDKVQDIMTLCVALATEIRSRGFR